MEHLPEMVFSINLYRNLFLLTQIYPLRTQMFPNYSPGLKFLPAFLHFFLSLSLSILAFFFPPSFHQQIFTEAILSDKFVWNSTLSQSNILVVPLPDVVIKWSHSSYFSTSQRLKIEPYPPFFLVSLKFREYFSLHWQRNNAVLV